jgi:S-adenosylmethionine decarboxylase
MTDTMKAPSQRARAGYVELSLLPWGRHAVADCRGIGFGVLNDGPNLERVLRLSVVGAGASLLSIRTHIFQPHGVTVCAILAESHVSIHTYPEHGVAMLDAFTCGSIDPTDVLEPIIGSLSPQSHSLRLLERGFHPDRLE